MHARLAYNARVTPASRPVTAKEREESWALGPGAVAGAGGHVAVAGALVLVTGRPGRHAVAVGAADPAVLEAVVVPARLGAPPRAIAVAEFRSNSHGDTERRRRQEEEEEESQGRRGLKLHPAGVSCSRH